MFCCGPSVTQEPLFAQYTVTLLALHSVRLDPQSIVLTIGKKREQKELKILVSEMVIWAQSTTGLYQG